MKIWAPLNVFKSAHLIILFWKFPKSLQKDFYTTKLKKIMYIISLQIVKNLINNNFFQIAVNFI
jgi:hypothetical protein